MNERSPVPKTVALGGALVLGLSLAETGILGEAPARQADVVIKNVNDIFTDRTEIRVGDMALPKNIGTIAASTVEVVSFYKDPQRKDPKSGKAISRGLIGSGTTVDYKGGKLVVTAAHVVRKTTKNCGDERIRFLQSGNRLSSMAIRAASQTSSKGSKGLYENGRDAVLVKPRFWFSELEQNMVGLHVQPRVNLNKGDTVFSLGYGSRKNSDPSPTSPRINERRPVIVPGIVVAADQKSVKFITGVSATRNSATDSNYHGDSGGTVVDAGGKYVGDVVRLDNPMRGWKLESKYDINLPPELESRNISTSTANIVDASVLANMAGAMQPCN